MNQAIPVDPRPDTIAGAKADWEIVVGLEVHAQISSRAKLFSGASTRFGAAPNQNVDFIDAGMPGVLPVVNEFCIEQAVRTGLGLRAKINLFSAFDRKNYFYPDLPQGYQISQLYHPVVGPGKVIVETRSGYIRTVRIDHLHLEQDAGKSLHDLDPNSSFVDFNRSGVALMEIVSCPDIRSSEEAAAYILKLRQIMRYLGTCDGNMQNGNLRADVNVSVREKGSTEFGTRCEIKNMNSTKFIQQAIDFEARRQIALLEDGGSVVQETRLYEPASGRTRSMRSKEEAQDYRYFPCPDLLPLHLDQEWVDRIACTIPELPDEKKSRLVTEYGITNYDATVLVSEVEHADYFELVAAGRDGKLAANWVINELFGRLNKDGKSVGDSSVTADQIGGIIDLVSEDIISGRTAKDVFDIIWNEGGDPASIVSERGLQQVSDDVAIRAQVQDLIKASPKQADKARKNPKVAGWFVGQVMKATQGKANPKRVNQIVRELLALD